MHRNETPARRFGGAEPQVHAPHGRRVWRRRRGRPRRAGTKDPIRSCHITMSQNLASDGDPNRRTPGPAPIPGRASASTPTLVAALATASARASPAPFVPPQVPPPTPFAPCPSHGPGDTAVVIQCWGVPAGFVQRCRATSSTPKNSRAETVAIGVANHSDVVPMPRLHKGGEVVRFCVVVRARGGVSWVPLLRPY